MPAIANTFLTTAAKGNREELSNVVNMIDRQETPVYSLIGKTSAASKFPEWETDTLEAPAANAQPEGNEYNFNAITPVARLGNSCQIFTKTFIVSNTQNAVSNAGDREKTNEQKIKKGIEIRRDVELAILTNTASKRTDARQLGGLPSWYASNVSRGATGANGGFQVGTGLTAAATNGTQRAFTKVLLDDTMQALYQNGGKAKYVVLSPYAKRVFSTFMSDPAVAPFRTATTRGENAIIGAADMYVGDFGTVAMVPNYIMGLTPATARNIHLIDPDMLEFAWLRKIKEDKDLAKTGDADKRAIVGEGTLCVKNQQGLGVIADIFGMTAAT